MTTDQAILELHKITAEVNSLFAHLIEKELNWKPAPDKWSIAQCLDHLIVTNRTYYPQFDTMINGEHRYTWYQNSNFLSRFFGKKFIHDLGPEMRATYKNPGIFAPSQSELPVSIVDDFNDEQKRMEGYLSQLGKTDSANVMHSPAGKIFIYSLADAITVIVIHEQRHLQQAKRVMMMDAFPK